MNLFFNPSGQLIKQWKPELSQTHAETHPLLKWRIDKIQLGNSSANYICVNEPTLYSFLLVNMPRKSQRQVEQAFIERLSTIYEQLHFPPAAQELLSAAPIAYRKNTCRKLLGCVNDMRVRYDVHLSRLESVEVAEERVNEVPIKGVSSNYIFPNREFLILRNTVQGANKHLIHWSISEDHYHHARSTFRWHVPIALRALHPCENDPDRLVGAAAKEDLYEFDEIIHSALLQPGSFEPKKKLMELHKLLKALRETF